MKILIIAGEPATGKSFLMKGLIQEIGFIKKREIDGLPCTVSGAIGRILVLGQYFEGDDFGGTDRFSMAVQPKVVSLLDRFDEEFDILLFEGDRLFNGKFLETIRKDYDIRIFYLKVSDEEKKRRHAKRNDTQTAEWLKSRVDKIDYILKYSKATGNRYNIVELKNETLEDFDQNKKFILKELDK